MRQQIVFDLLRSDGSFVTTLRASNKSFDYKLNEPGSAKCVVNTKDYDPEIINQINTNYALQVRIIGVDEKNQNINRIIWLGRITTPNISFNADKGEEIEIEAEEYLGLLALNFTSQNYTDVIESELVWELINTAQTDTTIGGVLPSGALQIEDINLNFKKGFLDQDTPVRSLKPSDDDLVKIFKTFTNSGGGDIEITPTITKNTVKEVSWYKSRGIDRPDIIYDVTLQNIGVIYDTEVYNFVIGYGKDKIRAVAFDVESIKKHGRRQRNESYSDISLQAELQARVDADLNRFKQSRLGYKVTIIDIGNFGKFDLGDKIRFRLNGGNALKIDDLFRVRELKVDAGDNDELKLDMTVSNSNLPVGYTGSFVKKYKETNRSIYQSNKDLNKP